MTKRGRSNIPQAQEQLCSVNSYPYKFIPVQELCPEAAGEVRGLQRKPPVSRKRENVIHPSPLILPPALLLPKILFGYTPDHFCDTKAAYTKPSFSFMIQTEEFETT